MSATATAQVFAPSTVEEAAAAMEETARSSATVGFVGGGTALGLGRPPRRLDAVIRTERLARIVEHAPSDQIVVVEAGVTLAALQRVLAAQGQRLAIDPPLAEHATMGGLVATNAFGPRRTRYGSLRDLIIGVSLVRADGALARGGGKVVKNVAGFDLPKMMVGSLGTLGLIATATFRLHPMPESDVTLLVPGRTAAGVRELVSAIRTAQLEATAVAAILDGQLFDVAIRVEGFSAGVAEQRGRLRQLLGGDVLAEAEARAFWERHDALRTAGPFRAKVAFLPAALEALATGPLARLMESLAGPSFVVYPTLGLGFVAGSPSDAARLATADAFRASVAGSGGSLVLEEAPDEVRALLDPWGPATGAFGLMRALKSRLDPEGRLNPGRFVGGDLMETVGATGRRLLDDCVHCGFCLAACPTYKSWGEEMDSPRGRIHLMRGLADGSIALDGDVVLHFDRCLGCMACVPACPSGVKYDVLIEEARALVEERHRRGLFDALHRALLFAVMPYPRRLRVLAAFGRVYAASGLRTLVRRSGLTKLLPRRLAQLEALMPEIDAATLSARLPSLTPAASAPRFRVGLVAGCVQSVFFPGVNEATVRVLAAEGCEVVVPEGQGCCGALSIHSGRAAESKKMAAALMDVFEKERLDAIIVNAAGCGFNLKDYGRLFADDPARAQRAATFSAKVRDVTEFLASIPRVATRHPITARVAYHDACHLANAQNVKAAPRALLSEIPGVTLLEIPDADQCCGSAGIYNLVQPEASDEIGRRKAENVLSVKADLLASANPGCTLQIARLIAERGASLPMAHPIEILDASLAGRALS